MTTKDDLGTNKQDEDVDTANMGEEDGDSTVQTPERDWAAEARKMGWRPKDVYKGPPDKFIEAQAFVENGERNLPIIRAALKSTQDEVDRLKKQGADHARVIESARAREVADLQSQLADALQARKEAVSAGDGEAFEAAEGAVKKLEGDVAAAKAPPKDTSSKGGPTQADEEAFAAWSAAHPRFNDDPVFQALCNSLTMSPEFKDKAGKNLREEFWDEVYTAAERQMEKQGYSRADDKNRGGSQRGGRGSDTTGRTGGTGARSYERLTQDMKRTCDRMSRDFGYEGKRLEAFRKDYASQCSDDAFSN